MNKIHTINLGGHPFTVDEDAYEYLQAYVRSLKKHFKNSAGCDEIIADIENRLAELLVERAEGKAIVTIREIKEVISIMGSPEEFGADPIDEKRFDPERPRKEKTGRRLFKDPEDKVISGVCSGIAAYFGINDPTWIRLLFAVLILGGGISFWLYIILSIILPKADSAADRLAMRGEPIDYASIAKKVQDEIEHLSKEFGTPVDPETKSQMDAGMATAGKAFRTSSSVLAGLFAFFGNIVKNFFPLLLKITAVGIIIVLSMMIIGLLFGWTMLWPYSSSFIAGPKAMGALAMMNSFFLVMIPFVFVVTLVARFFNGSRLPRSVAAGLGGLWLLNLLSGVSLGVNTARQFSSTEHIEKKIFEGKLNQDVIYVKTGNKKHREDIFTLFGEAWMEDNKLILPRIPIHITKSQDNQFHIIQEKHASGESTNQALRRATNINDVATWNGNELLVDNFMEIDKNDKVRNQHTSITIQVPVGKQVRIDKEMHPVDGERDPSKDYPWEMAGKLWIMSDKGLICPEYDELNNKKPEAEVQEIIGEVLEKANDGQTPGASDIEKIKEGVEGIKSDLSREQEKIKTELNEVKTDVQIEKDKIKKEIQTIKQDIKNEIKEVRERTKN